jgi:hypothetical protein
MEFSNSDKLHTLAGVLVFVTWLLMVASIGNYRFAMDRENVLTQSSHMLLRKPLLVSSALAKGGLSARVALRAASDKTTFPKSTDSCSVLPAQRHDCRFNTEPSCLEQKCCWRPNSEKCSGGSICPFCFHKTA